MTVTTDKRVMPRQIAMTASLLAAGLGALVLLGWTFDIPVLKSFIPGYITMKANAALAMFLCGASLALLGDARVGRRGRCCVACMGTTVIILGGLTLCEHLLAWDAGLDQWLFLDTGAPSNPGRMAPSTAFCLLLIGGSLWAAAWPVSQRVKLPLIEAMGVAVVIVGGFATIGFALDALFGLRSWGYTGMAVNTAAEFILLGVAMLALVRSEGGLRWSLSAVVTGGFVVGVVSLLVAAGISRYFINRLQQSAALVSQTQEVLKKIQEITADVATLGSSQRSYINTGNESLLKQNEEMKNAIRKDLRDFRALTIDDSLQQQRADQIEPLIARRIEWGEQTTEARRKGGLSAAEQIIATGTGIAISDGIRRLTKEMADEEYSLLALRQKREEATSTTTFLLLPLGVFLSITLLSLGVFFLNAGVAERAQAEEAAAQLAAIVEFSDDSIIGTDLQGNVVSWNTGSEKLYGYLSAEMVGRPIMRIVPKGREREEAQILERVQTGDSVTHFDTERVGKDGGIVPVSVTVSPVRDSTGKIVGASKVARNISDRLRVEKELRDSYEHLERNVAERTAQYLLAKERAEAAGRAKSDFMASMSHELRTPLNGIIGFSEFLVDGKPGPLNAKQKEYLEDILNSGRHLLQLINDVLDLAKVEAGKIELHPEPFEIAKAIGEVCSVAGPIAHKKRIRVGVSVAAELEGVTLDQMRFKQVVYNLLSNALKFTDEGGAVEINCTPHGQSQFKLAVRDSGIGIKPEDLQRLFKEFEQIESGTARRYQGTGLGLALTRRIVEMQTGCIEVASEFGKGTVFTVTLPTSVPREVA